jgi:hypothetical protein
MYMFKTSSHKPGTNILTMRSFNVYLDKFMLPKV